MKIIQIVLNKEDIVLTLLKLKLNAEKIFLDQRWWAWIIIIVFRNYIWKHIMTLFPKLLFNNCVILSVSMTKAFWICLTWWLRINFHFFQKIYLQTKLLWTNQYHYHCMIVYWDWGEKMVLMRWIKINI